jgi:hypothetical protein
LFPNTNQYHIEVVILPPECTAELQQRALPSSIGNKSSVTDVIVTGPFLENRHPPPLPTARPFHRGAGGLNVYTSGPDHQIQSVGFVGLMKYSSSTNTCYMHTHTHTHTHTHIFTHSQSYHTNRSAAELV